MSQESIILTDKAAEKVYELIKEEGNFNLKLRAFVTGGGCSGMQYGFTFDDTIKEDDIQPPIEKIVKDPVTGEDVAVQLLVDSICFPYLQGAKIDYREDINGSHFVITGNPNAKTTCGCGSSFATE